jgi:hypothetical protein
MKKDLSSVCVFWGERKDIALSLRWTSYTAKFMFSSLPDSDSSQRFKADAVLNSTQFQKKQQVNIRTSGALLLSDIIIPRLFHFVHPHNENCLQRILVAPETNDLFPLVVPWIVQFMFHAMTTYIRIITDNKLRLPPLATCEAYRDFSVGRKEIYDKT